MIDCIFFYLIIAFFIGVGCDEEGFDAAAKGLFWPIFLLIHTVRSIFSEAKGE